MIVGERSYGKGSVQKIIKLGESDPPTALKLTTDTYWRPSGKNIHRYPDSKETDDWGVKPNPGFEIPMKDDERLDYLRYKRNKDIIRRDKPKEPARSRSWTRPWTRRWSTSRASLPSSDRFAAPRERSASERASSDFNLSQRRARLRQRREYPGMATAGCRGQLLPALTQPGSPLRVDRLPRAPPFLPHPAGGQAIRSRVAATRDRARSPALPATSTSVNGEPGRVSAGRTPE